MVYVGEGVTNRVATLMRHETRSRPPRPGRSYEIEKGSDESFAHRMADYCRESLETTGMRKHLLGD